jgi:NRAMP (natural resistance-associated macrophage protein)-like metal ion transporter
MGRLMGPREGWLGGPWAWSRRALRVLGPGLITGASDDDPSGIGTYAQAGARFGYATLWTAPAMLPLMAVVQYICARIGLVSGRGLAAVLRAYYPRAVLYPAVLGMVVANTVNAGADLAAIAAALRLLLPLPAELLVVLVAAAILGLQLLGSYRLIERVFRWLTLALLAYVGAALLARPDPLAVLGATIVPTVRVDAPFVAMLVALLGTTISPYLFFWQASQEVEEEIDEGRILLRERRGATRRELQVAWWDTLAGMILSQVVAYFVMLASGATLFLEGRTTIESAADAAAALRPLAGDASALLFSIGLIGAGVLAVPVLTASAAYGVAEALGWREGLDRSPRRAPQFYGVIVVATLVGVGLALIGLPPFQALVVAALINGLLAPLILVLVMSIANDRRVMGTRTNGRWLNLLGWATTGLMGLAAVALVVTSL